MNIPDLFIITVAVHPNTDYSYVIPAKAGIHTLENARKNGFLPKGDFAAFVGMT